MKKVKHSYLLCMVACVALIASSGYAEDTDVGAFSYDAHGKRDPMWSLVDSNGGIINYDSDLIYTDLNLEGIMLGSGNSHHAIINGKIVSAGDEIGQFKILRIEQHKVIVQKGAEEFDIKLKGGI